MSDDSTTVSPTSGFSITTPTGSTVQDNNQNAKITVEILNLTLTIEGTECFVKKEFECFVYEHIIKPNIEKSNVTVSKAPNTLPDMKATGWV